MPYRSIFVGPLFDSQLEDRMPAPALIDYALELAAIGNAHLSIGVGSCKFSAPSAGLVRAAGQLIAAANKEREQQAERYGAGLLTRAHGAGVAASLELIHAEYGGVADRFTRLARVSDVSVLQPSEETLSLMQGVVEEVLFNSGRPVIIVPTSWNKPANLDNVVVSWDGSAKAARAVGDALPLLSMAKQVEIVTISGDRDTSKRLEGAEIAAHLARHCKAVTVTNLPARDGDIGETLQSHVGNTRASLLVMGAFAHNRLRQFILGGVTSKMIVDPPLPVLLSC
jgi:nucleotide-binding universal stress UspA family protein